MAEYAQFRPLFRLMMLSSANFFDNLTNFFGPNFGVILTDVGQSKLHYANLDW